MPETEPLVHIQDVVKDYRGLRPLRIQLLELHAGQSLALLGFDLAMAEVFVNLVTGAHLPDTGEIRVFGRPTSDIRDASDWMATLDQFGLVSERSVLVDQLTTEQNLAMPLTLEVAGMDAPLRTRVRGLADEVGLSGDELAAPATTLGAAARLRLRLARALALGPRVLLAEHPNATLPQDDLAGFAADYARVVGARGIASIVLTADRTFAGAIGDQVLTLQPASGTLQASGRGWRRWFS